MKELKSPFIEKMEGVISKDVLKIVKCLIMCLANTKIIIIYIKKFTIW